MDLLARKKHGNPVGMAATDPAYEALFILANAGKAGPWRRFNT